jgi:hypothetical protein
MEIPGNTSLIFPTKCTSRGRKNELPASDVERLTSHVECK